MEDRQERETAEILWEEETNEEVEFLDLEEWDGQGRRKKRIMLAILLPLAVLLVAAGGIYYGGMLYYRVHFFPNTSINGMDCGGQKIESTVEALDASVADYGLTILGRDYKTGESGAVLGTIQPEDINLIYTDTREAVQLLLDQQDEAGWIKAYLDGSYPYSLEYKISFDEARLESVVNSWDACKSENMRMAEDAYISGYSGEKGGYEVIPETLGTELDVERGISLIAQAVSRREETIDLAGQGCYREASVRSDDEKLNGIVNTANKWLGTRIVYDWNGTEVVLDRETLKDWVSIEEGDVRLDEKAVTDFVKAQAAAYDTYGRKKSFVTVQGVEVTLPSRTYGWKTDTAGEAEALRQLIYQGSAVEKEPLYSVEARQKGENDVGNSYVEADLSSQHLYLYQDGKIVLETDFVSGTMISTYDCVTPEGIFGLLYKTKDAVLKGETYRTPVKYWMPFYGNYGMHDARWRKAFGGEIFKTNGSHGCINLPPRMAEQIYQYVAKGFPVVCYYSQGIPYVGPPVEPAPGDGIPQEQVNPEEVPAG